MLTITKMVVLELKMDVYVSLLREGVQFAAESKPKLNIKSPSGILPQLKLLVVAMVNIKDVINITEAVLATMQALVDSNAMRTFAFVSGDFATEDNCTS